MESPEARSAFKRTKIACEECRKNKRKCDGVQPICGLCLKGQRTCEYASDISRRKRKRWDDDYVQGLEEQVKALTALINASNQKELSIASLGGCFSTRTQDEALSEFQATGANTTNTMADTLLRQGGENASHPNSSSNTLNNHTELRSASAMEDLGSLMLKLGIEDEGEPCFVIPTTSSSSSQSKDAGRPLPEGLQKDYPIPPEFLSPLLRGHLLECFCKHFNQIHQTMDTEEIIRVQTTDLSSQAIDLRFRNMAALSVGARFLDLLDAEALSLSALAYAESLSIDCLKYYATPYAVQGLTLLAWLHLLLGNDMASWNFNSCATGLSLRLGLHVTALSKESLSEYPIETERYNLRVRTFWSYFSIDRMITSVLGMNCTMPWQRVRVRPFSSIITHERTIDEIAFCRQGQLWHLWDSFMDQIYAFDWQTLTVSGKKSLMSRSHEALLSFQRDSHPDLRGSPSDASESVICFQLAYHTTVILIYRPFLGDPPESQTLSLALQSATYAAMSTCRILREVRRTRRLQEFPPQIMNYIVCAAVIHLLNATCGRTRLGRRSSGNLKLCIDVLVDVGNRWPIRKRASIRFIQELAHKWKVVWALPLQFSAPLSRESINNIDIDVATSAGIGNRAETYGIWPNSDFTIHDSEAANFALNQLAPLAAEGDSAAFEWLFSNEDASFQYDTALQ